LIDTLGGKLGGAQEVNRHLSSDALRNTLLCALGIALMRRTSSLSLIDLGALLQAATDAVNCALARLGLRRQRAIPTTVSLLAQAGAIVAVSVLRAIIQTSTNIAAIARPARVAVAVTLHALSVTAAALAISRAAGIAVSATPSVLAGA